MIDALIVAMQGFIGKYNEGYVRHIGESDSIALQGLAEYDLVPVTQPSPPTVSKSSISRTPARNNAPPPPRPIEYTEPETIAVELALTANEADLYERIAARLAEEMNRW